ncbi:hypothetical protein [Altericista sp. CCNU0014]|uniref:hypothetical protein n=1 Tax=Altericista sp. CCNU0014 TaxID=3082949 RepID=UPI00384CDE43
MAALTPLRARRFANRIAEATQQYVTFRLRQYWFALPVEALLRVSSVDAGSRDDTGNGLAATETTETDALVIIDVSQQIFAETETAAPKRPFGSAGASEANASCSIAFQTSTGDRFGFPIDSQPKLQRIPQSKVGPFTSEHPLYGKLQSVSAIIVTADDAEPIFLLGPDRLCQSNDGVAYTHLS